MSFGKILLAQPLSELFDRKVGLFENEFLVDVGRALFAQTCVHVPAGGHTHPMAAAWTMPELGLDFVQAFGVGSAVRFTA